MLPKNNAPVDIAEPEIVSNANVLSAPDYINTSTNTVEHNSAIPESVTENTIIDTPSIGEPLVQSPIEKALATRNMLRSRKKGLENTAKKSDDVKGRQDNNRSDPIELKTQEESKVIVPALETISDQAL